MKPNRIFEFAQAPTAGEVAHFGERLKRQGRLAPGQNLQMMDFAELGRPSLRAHVIAPAFARNLRSNRAVARGLQLAPYAGWVVLVALALIGFAGT